MSQLPNQAPEFAKFSQKGTTLVRAIKSDKKDFLELEIGDIKDKSVQPQAKVKKWGNESNFSIRRVGDYSTASTEYSEGKLKFKRSDEEVHIYERPDLKEGGFEIDVLVKQRPTSNKFFFSLEFKDLVFHYQKPITPVMVGEGKDALPDKIRDSETTGSYAVYKENEKETRGGGTIYGNNKVGHIYRPKIYDDKGNFVYGDIRITPGLKRLTVTVPQDFIDAVDFEGGGYMVVDPSFGYTTAGASEVLLGHEGSSFTDNYYRAGLFTVPNNALVESMSGHIRRVGGTSFGDYCFNFAFFAYSDNAASPDAFLGKTAESADQFTNSDQWETLTMTTPLSLDAGDYWLTAVGTTMGGTYYGGYCYLSYDTTGGNTAVKYLNGAVNAYTSPIDPFPTPDSTGTDRLSIYATYKDYGKWKRYGVPSDWSGTGASESNSYTVDANADILIVRSLSQDVIGVDEIVSTMTFNGVALTLAEQRDNGNYNTEIWYLLNPPAGTYTLAVNYVGTCDHLVVAENWSGAAQSGQPASSDSSVGSGDPVEDLAAGLGNLVLDSILHADQGDTFTPNGNQVEDYQAVFYSFEKALMSNVVAETSGIYNVGWTGSPAVGADVYAVVAFLADTGATLSVDEINWTFSQLATPTSITKAAQYAIRTVTALTKSAQYVVRTLTSITKSATYYIRTTGLITKTAEYAISFNTALTKASQYAIKTTSLITKSAAYQILVVGAITKGAQYAILTTSLLTKGAEYVINTTSSLTKSATYTILSTPLITKSAEYVISLSATLQKSAQYAILTTTSLTKGASYYISLGATALTKSAAYRVLTTSVLTKSAEYAISITTAIQKAGAYRVRTTQLLQKSAEYVIILATSVTKTAQYAIKTTGLITKSAEYTINLTTSLTNGATYAIRTVQSLTKSAQYVITSVASLTKAAAYRVRTVTLTQLSAQYVIGIITAINKGAEYFIRTTVTLTKSAAYVISSGVSVTKAGQYAIRTVVTLTKSAQYFIAGESLVIQKVAQYAIHTVSSLTLPAQYVIGLVGTLTKSASYAIKSYSITQLSAQYVVLSIVGINKAGQYAIKTTASLIKSAQYVISTSQALTKGASYMVRTIGLLNIGAEYSISTTGALIKAGQYAVRTSLLVQLSAQYVVTVIGSIQVTAQYVITPPSYSIQLSARYHIRVCYPYSEGASPYSPTPSPFSAMASPYSPGTDPYSEEESPYSDYKKC